MMLLLMFMLAVAYLGVVISVIFRLNQARVLSGKILFAFLLPFVHFIVLPIRFILFDKTKDTTVFTRVGWVWAMIVLFPFILAKFVVELTVIKTITEGERVQAYEDTCIKELDGLLCVA